MSRYKYTKLKNLGPVHGFLIHTPDDRKLKDVYPQFIVRELNRMADRIKRLEAAGDEMIWAFCTVSSASMMTEREADALKLWNEAKEAK